MRLTTIIYLFFSLCSISLFAQRSQSGWASTDTGFVYITEFKPVKLLKEVKPMFKGMVYIEGGTFTMGRKPKMLQPTERDSILLFGDTEKRVTISPYLINDHEVTNNEYRRFTNWVRDSIARQILAKTDSSWYKNPETKALNREKELNWKSILTLKLLSSLFDTLDWKDPTNNKIDTDKLIYSFDGKSMTIYPDTTRWAKEFRYIFNEPMTRMYNWHPAYDHYPVCGVSWKQAEAYCHWLTERTREAYHKKGIEYPFPGFRLPTEAEWEFAAIGNSADNDKYERQNMYPWHGHELKGKEGYMANFGPIIGQNGIRVKSYTDDGCFYTSIIGAYPANDYHLFDMGGNLAEWTLNSAINYRSDIKTDTSKIEAEEMLMLKAKVEAHNSRIFEEYPEPRIIKGGSWADGPGYVLNGTKRAYSEDRSSCMIGFRIAMSVNEFDLIKHFYKEPVEHKKQLTSVYHK